MIRKAVVVVVIGLLGLLGYRLLASSPGPTIRNDRPNGENIICFGDSLTYGTGAPKGKDYPTRLSRMISGPVMNKGVPGDTTARALDRLDKDVLSQSPRIVLITLGGNDLKNGISKDIAFRNLRVIIESIQDMGALVIVGGIDVPVWGRGFEDGYRQTCRETGAVLVPNIFEGIFGNRQLMSDAIHPNGEGYELIAEKFHQALKPYL
ncbi:arylesterase [Syntrophobacter fumaroxidans]|uniref:Lipolytic enzyme, G-D-S-L family n=1 Tax=Syntrophobacter fumaroxidans (strain DSM 10017 / MPOB) TaxID=335543 RepID=A0LIG2_SYNFM|nr:arylesterase [Syntrophobacter fumaroxidans]ABK17214.1 lipolytic enzyme, G-D-S-L family [Syntrophobacter fumaroxidans MPOB]